MRLKVVGSCRKILYGMKNMECPNGIRAASARENSKSIFAERSRELCCMVKLGHESRLAFGIDLCGGDLNEWSVL